MAYKWKDLKRQRIESVLKKHIKDIPDFPKKGIMFRDISPLMINHFSTAINSLKELYSREEWNDIDAIAGIESRGFIFGAALAQKLDKPFLMIRKAGKLPGYTYKAMYELEYGHDSLEMQRLDRPLEKVLIVDDVVATGGTLQAAISLSEQARFTKFALCSLINLKYANSNNKLFKELRSVITYEK